MKEQDILRVKQEIEALRISVWWADISLQGKRLNFVSPA
jgi:hypothetical protein